MCYVWDFSGQVCKTYNKDVFGISFEKVPATKVNVLALSSPLLAGLCVQYVFCWVRFVSLFQVLHILVGVLIPMEGSAGHILSRVLILEYSFGPNMDFTSLVVEYH